MNEKLTLNVGCDETGTSTCTSFPPINCSLTWRSDMKLLIEPSSTASNDAQLELSNKKIRTSVQRFPVYFRPTALCCASFFSNLVWLILNLKQD